MSLSFPTANTIALAPMIGRPHSGVSFVRPHNGVSLDRTSLDHAHINLASDEGLTNAKAITNDESLTSAIAITGDQNLTSAMVELRKLELASAKAIIDAEHLASAKVSPMLGVSAMTSKCQAPDNERQHENINKVVLTQYD